MSFSVRLLQDTFAENKENFVVSPFSIYMATALLASGAEGETLAELSAILGNEDVENNLKNYMAQKSDKIEINNSIWGSSFRDEYVQAMKDTFSAEAKDLPENTSPINVWVRKKTKGRIKDILDFRKTGKGDLFLVNTIYFKDKWQIPFDVHNTKQKDFYSLDGNVDKVNMMYLEAEMKYYENSQIQAVQLPYLNGDVMTIILPQKKLDFSNVWPKKKADFQVLSNN